MTAYIISKENNNWFFADFWIGRGAKPMKPAPVEIPCCCLFVWRWTYFLMLFYVKTRLYYHLELLVNIFYLIIICLDAPNRNWTQPKKRTVNFFTMPWCRLKGVQKLDQLKLWRHLKFSNHMLYLYHCHQWLRQIRTSVFPLKKTKAN